MQYQSSPEQIQAQKYAIETINGLSEPQVRTALMFIFFGLKTGLKFSDLTEDALFTLMNHRSACSIFNGSFEDNTQAPCLFFRKD